MDKSAFNVNYQNQHLASKIVVGLERISEAFRALLWDYAKEIGLSPIQMQIMIFVKYHDASQCNVSFLAQEFNITKPTVSDAIKVLHQKELIEKNPSETDKRAYHISLSVTGEKQVSKIQHFAQPIQAIFGEIDSREQIQFFQTLSKVIFRLHQTEVIGPQRTCKACRFYDTSRTELPYCKLLEKTLLAQDIRIDCPEFEEKTV